MRSVMIAFLLFALTTLGGCAQSERTVTTPRPNAISEFQGPYRFLSNFWPAEVVYEGIAYPSVEHAYQAAKTMDLAQRRRIAALADPASAKREGRRLILRTDWETVKFRVMDECVRDKFTRHAELRRLLLETGDAELIEGNTWGDRVWAACFDQVVSSARK